MAVHTELEPTAIQRILDEFGFDCINSVEPAIQGTENSNFFVDATGRRGAARLVLTLFESNLANSAFLLRLLDELNASGLPVPAPCRTESGDRMVQYLGRDAMLVERFSGSHPTTPTPAQCRHIGAFLARMHLAAQPLAGAANLHPRNSQWLRQQIAELAPLLGSEARFTLEAASKQVLEFLSRTDVQALAQGVVHGDLFRDNALFDGDTLVAVIDFHHASRALLAFDIAVALIDWTVDAEGKRNEANRESLLQGYEHIRPLGTLERTSLASLCDYAALCFWLSRLSQVRRLAGWGHTHLPQWRLERVLVGGQAKDPRWFEYFLGTRFRAGVRETR